MQYTNVSQSMQCIAFTKKHRRCLKKANPTEKTCLYHNTYYSNWFATHPPPIGFRLEIAQKAEYVFQIEHKYIEITNDYIKTFREREESDYYEYLLHLPHIQWDANMKMIACLLVRFLNQPSCITLCENNVEYYFHNMFGNPSFSRENFLLRLMLVIEQKKMRENFLPNLTESRIVDIFRVLMNHTAFEGCMYMSWGQSLLKKLRNSNILPIFVRIYFMSKQEWLEEKRMKIKSLRNELLDIAMHPSRVQDWYIDWDEKKHIRVYFTEM